MSTKEVWAEKINIVLHVIFFQPSEYQRLQTFFRNAKQPATYETLQKS